MTLAFLPPFARVALNASAFTLLTFYLCVASSAAAQTLPDVPRPQTGGEWAQVFAPVSESFASIAPSPFLEPAEIQREGEWTFIEASLLEALKSGEPPAFQSIQLSGEMTTRQKTALTRLATPYQGKPLALQDYHALAKAVQEDCERRGRLCKLSFSAEGQALTLAVAPITLEAVTVENSRYFRARAIRYQLGMRPGDALNLNKLERRMRLIQDNPDIRLKAELKPGKGLETVTLTLKADNTLPVHAVAYWNNMDQYYYGSHQWLTSITTGLNNTLGLNDTTLVSVIPGGRTPGVFLQYQVPLNAHGTRLIANWSRMNADPGGKDYEAFRLTGRAWALSLGVSQPLYVGETSRLSADLNFDVQQFRTNFKKHNPIEKEQLRILRAGLQFDHATEKQELSVRNQVEVGLDVMGGHSQHLR